MTFFGYIRELKTKDKPPIPNQKRKEYSDPDAAAEIFLLEEEKLEPLTGRKIHNFDELLKAEFKLA